MAYLTGRLIFSKRMLRQGFVAEGTGSMAYRPSPNSGMHATCRKSEEIAVDWDR